MFKLEQSISFISSTNNQTKKDIFIINKKHSDLSNRFAEVDEKYGDYVRQQQRVELLLQQQKLENLQEVIKQEAEKEKEKEKRNAKDSAVHGGVIADAEAALEDGNSNTKTSTVKNTDAMDNVVDVRDIDGVNTVEIDSFEASANKQNALLESLGQAKYDKQTELIIGLQERLQKQEEQLQQQQLITAQLLTMINAQTGGQGLGFPMVGLIPNMDGFQMTNASIISDSPGFGVAMTGGGPQMATLEGATGISNSDTANTISNNDASVTSSEVVEMEIDRVTNTRPSTVGSVTNTVASEASVHLSASNGEGVEDGDKPLRNRKNSKFESDVADKSPDPSTAVSKNSSSSSLGAGTMMKNRRLSSTKGAKGEGSIITQVDDSIAATPNSSSAGVAFESNVTQEQSSRQQMFQLQMQQQMQQQQQHYLLQVKRMQQQIQSNNDVTPKTATLLNADKAQLDNYVSKSELKSMLVPLHSALNGYASRSDIDMDRVEKMYESLIVLDKEHSALLLAHKELAAKHASTEVSVYNLINQLMNVVDTCQGNVERHEQWNILQSRQLTHVANTLNIKLEHVTIEDIRDNSEKMHDKLKGVQTGHDGPRKQSAPSYSSLMQQYTAKKEGWSTAHPGGVGFATPDPMVPVVQPLDKVIGSVTADVPKPTVNNPDEVWGENCDMSNSKRKSKAMAQKAKDEIPIPPVVVPVAPQESVCEDDDQTVSTSDHFSGGFSNSVASSTSKIREQMRAMQTQLEATPVDVSPTAMIQSLTHQLSEYKEQFCDMVREYQLLLDENKRLKSTKITNDILDKYSMSTAKASVGFAADACAGNPISDEEKKKNDSSLVNKSQLLVALQQKDEISNAQFRDIKIQVEKLRQLISYNARAVPENNPSYVLEPKVGGVRVLSPPKSAGTAIQNATNPPSRKPPQSAPSQSIRTHDIGIGFEEVVDAQPPNARNRSAGVGIAGVGGLKSRPTTSSRAAMGRKFAVRKGSPPINRTISTGQGTPPTQSNPETELEARMNSDLNIGQDRERTYQPVPPPLTHKPSSSQPANYSCVIPDSFDPPGAHAQPEVLVWPSRRQGVEENSEIGNSKSRQKSKANDNIGNPLMDIRNAHDLVLTDSTITGNTFTPSHLDGKILSGGSYSSSSEEMALVMQNTSPSNLWNADFNETIRFENIGNGDFILDDQCVDKNKTNVVNVTHSNEYVSSETDYANGKLPNNVGIGENFIDCNEHQGQHGTNAISSGNGIVSEQISELSEDSSMLYDYFKIDKPTGPSKKRITRGDYSNVDAKFSSRAKDIQNVKKKLEKEAKKKKILEQGRVFDASAGFPY